MMMMTMMMTSLLSAGVQSGGGEVPPKIVPFQFRSDLTPGSRTRVTCEAGEGDLPLTFSW